MRNRYYTWEVYILRMERGNLLQIKLLFDNNINDYDDDNNYNTHFFERI